MNNNQPQNDPNDLANDPEYKIIMDKLRQFLVTISQNDPDFIYEITAKKGKKVNTYRSKDVDCIISCINKHHGCRDIYITPYSTAYPEGTCGFEFGRRVAFSYVTVVDIDRYDPIDKNFMPYPINLEYIKDKSPSASFIISTGSGAQVWFVFDKKINHLQYNNLSDKITTHYHEIMPRGMCHVDRVSSTQQFRMPFTLNSKYDKLSDIYYASDKVNSIKLRDSDYISISRDELKEERKLRKANEKRNMGRDTSKKRKCNGEEENGIRDISPEERRFIDGALSKSIELNKYYGKHVETLIKLLHYGEHLSCRTFGFAIGTTDFRYANRLLHKYCEKGIIRRTFNGKGKIASRYKILIPYVSNYVPKKDDDDSFEFISEVDTIEKTVEERIEEVDGNKETEIVKKTKTEKLVNYAKIDGPGQWDKAMCRLARSVYKCDGNRQEAFDLWINKYYNLTSQDDPIGDLHDVYYCCLDKFDQRRWV